MRLGGACVLAIVLVPTSSHADERRIADVVSNVTTFINIGLDTVQSFRASDRKDALIRQGIRTGVVWGSTALLKKIFDRCDRGDQIGLRPDGSGCDGMPSAHAAFAFSAWDRSSGIRFAVTISLGTATGVERVRANRHTVKQSVAGALIGAGASFIR